MYWIDFVVFSGFSVDIKMHSAVYLSYLGSINLQKVRI